MKKLVLAAVLVMSACSEPFPEVTVDLRKSDKVDDGAITYRREVVETQEVASPPAAPVEKKAGSDRP